MENMSLSFNMSFKKDTEKTILLQVKGLLQIIVKFRTEKNLCTFLSSTRHPIWEGHKILPPGEEVV